MHQFKQLAVLALVPLTAAFLLAQQQRTETTTTTTTWNGTLLDAGCRSSHTEHKESKSDSAGNKSESTRTETVECPVVTTTTTFGLLTPEGKYIVFDPDSNTKIVKIVKSNKKWNEDMAKHAPVTVKVIGTAKGDTIVLQTIE